MRKGKVLLLMGLLISLILSGCMSAEEKEASKMSLTTIKNFLAAVERDDTKEMNKYVIKEGWEDILDNVELFGVNVGGTLDSLFALGKSIFSSEEKQHYEIEYKKTKEQSFDSNSGYMVVSVEVSTTNENGEEVSETGDMRFDMALKDGQWLITNVELIEE